jgi:hypothetical protein
VPPCRYSEELGGLSLGQPPNTRLKLTARVDVWNESFFSAPQLKRDPLGRHVIPITAELVAHTRSPERPHLARCLRLRSRRRTANLARSE